MTVGPRYPTLTAWRSFKLQTQRVMTLYSTLSERLDLDEVWNEVIRQRIKVTDVALRASTLKWHMGWLRLSEDRWTLEPKGLREETTTLKAECKALSTRWCDNLRRV
ncbi:jg10796 [Pararge aegeria aegeria]|uniref:Jg10796 protein n=1 Tax=Pararge aegeria aegeria TaxID=348720 RepID=A0A8S4R9P1_9NEOP|nr:jg10796 [Pararge aegeria aegeria]